MESASRPVIFLTGTTGFLGKVVLEELIRTSNEYDLGRVVVLIRATPHLNAQERFLKQVVPSPCFGSLPSEWTQYIQVVQGDLSQEYCGIEPEMWQEICPQITHIINCAASVAFDLPLQQAAKANISSIFNLLHLARSCSNLHSMVHTSTSYVAPYCKNRIVPRLPPLPYPAEEIYKDMLANRANESLLLEQTGYPNTYTLTKCVAEHILMAQKDTLSVVIVRPSIISCAWRYPMPGWIDSKAAVAGYVALLGAGYLRVIVANMETPLDVVPVDVVAHDVIKQAGLVALPSPNWSFSSSRETLALKADCGIIHSVVGTDKAIPNHLLASKALSYFKDIGVFQARRRPCKLRFFERKNLGFHFHDITSHRLPLYISSLYFDLTKDMRMAKKSRSLSAALKKINQIFPYYTRRTFDFEPSMPSTILYPRGGDELIVDQREFTPENYTEVICKGVKEYILKM
ncbi:hypothetical protein B0A52_02792 [Exophiala mesophila]|uniref:Fatty acyl-CoA reductase n=1 Tax=Exophiala mesophila TaxID=212818 RepID=A0A438NDM6_EXOME|nr:hypothetical protein B0A52_02792 [Exophiala mesophila]